MERADIPYLSATDLSELIKDREVSPVEVVEAYLERIDRLNDKLNAYITVCWEEAIEAAREAEKAIALGNYLGPMHGIPVAVKDQAHTKGIRTTFGSPIFADFVPDEDATVVSKLKESGAIPLGKSNMTEFGTTGFSHQFDTPRNPWDLERYTGGSSSGSGAATAGFLCATSLGEDTGGSIRGPATWCGLVGLRPSWGRVSRYGVRPGSWTMDTMGPISRTVKDCALTIQTIAGHDPKDPYSWNSPVPNYGKGLDGNIRGLKVGVITDLLYSEAVEGEVRDAVVKATSVLGELGATVTEISIPLARHAQTISSGLRVEAPVTYRELLRDRLREIGHDNRIGYLVGSVLPAQAYFKAQKLRVMLRQQVLEALDSVDVLVLPTSAVASPKVEPDPVIDSKEKAFRNSASLTPIFSLASTPALSINCGFTSQDLPIGLQIGGKPLDEETVLKVAYAYEQSTAWHNRKPPI